MKFYLGLLLLIITFSSYAQNDTVVLSNGDAIVGEIKSMDKNVLVMKTPYSDSDFKIEWDKVKSVRSDRKFIFSFSYGMHLTGNIRPDPNKAKQVIINEEGRDIDANLFDIVYIKAIDGNFIGSFEASVDLGYTYTKDNNNHQFTSRTSLSYRTDIFRANTSYNAVRSIQDNASTSKRTDATLGLRFFLKKDWFTGVSTDFLQSDELKLKLRTTTQGGIGKYLIHTNKHYLNIFTGMAWNHEKYTDPAEDLRNSLEALVGAEYNLFDFKDLSFFSSFMLYPGITEWGRLRFDFSADLKYDLPLDFYIKLGYTSNYDNKPVEGSSKNDNIIQTSFGWEF